MKTKRTRAGCVGGKRIAVFLIMLMLVPSLDGCRKKDKFLQLRVITLSAYQEQVTEAAQYFMEKHEGSRISVETLSDVKETRSSEIQKLKTETMSGKGPDVFILEGEDPGYAEESRPETLFSNIGKTMESGVFASLDSYMMKDSYWKKSTYKKEFLSAGQYDGRQYVIPMSCGYHAFASTAESENMAGATFEEWLMQTEMSGDTALCRTMAGWAGRMSGSLMQPAIDYQNKEILFDAEQWRKCYERVVSIYKKGVTNDYEETETHMLGRIDMTFDSLREKSMDTFQPVPTIDGKKLAIIKGYGAVGMSCEDKELAYEFLMLFLNSRFAEETGIEHTLLNGMIGRDGVPVQESAWQSRLDIAGVGDADTRKAILAGFHELEGAYFATPVENMITNSTMEIFNYGETKSEEEMNQSLGAVAQQAKEQYEAMVKE